jgi:3-hydroxybutyryl-CoA dehydrogenase
VTAGPLHVGILGAGVMGAGVAQVAATAGHSVVLVDVADDHLGAAWRAIRRSLLADRLRGGPATAANPLELVSFTTSYADLSDVDIVVENVTEDETTKIRAHRQLDRVRPAGPVVVNTSAIPVGWLAGHTSDPTRYVGVHFMNPVPAKPLVELIVPDRTDERVVVATQDFLRSIGKDWVTVADQPGFVSNRVLMAVINAAAALVAGGVASSADVDRVFEGCFGHPMGPLRTADLIGLDTVLRSLEVLRRFTGDPWYEPSPELVRLVAAGRVGRKSGAGFHEYRPGQVGVPSGAGERA